MNGRSGEKPTTGWARLLLTLKRAVRKWSEDKASRLGAALAYYALFSVAPLLIVAVGIAGLVFGEEAARGEIVAQIEDRVGSSVAGFLQEMMAGTRGGAGVAATVIGVVLTLLGASGLFLQLKGALNVVWDVPPRATKGIGNLLRTRALAFLSVLGFGLVLLAALAASSVISALSDLVSDEAASVATLLQWLSPVVMLGLLTVVFALVFKVLPDATVPWPPIWRGAAFTSIRGGRSAGHASPLRLLLGADLPAGSRVHAGSRTGHGGGAVGSSFGGGVGRTCPFPEGRRFCPRCRRLGLPRRPDTRLVEEEVTRSRLPGCVLAADSRPVTIG